MPGLIYISRLGRPRRLCDTPNFYSNDYINEDTPIATFELEYRTKGKEDPSRRMRT